MELPDHYFPANPCPYTMKVSKGSDYKRVTFAEYGAYENVNLSLNEENDTVQFWPKKGQQSTMGLSAVLPTIPLCDEPLEHNWTGTDRILGIANFKDTVRKMKSVIKVMPMMKKNLQGVGSLMEALQDVEKGKEGCDFTSLLHEKLPTSVRVLHQKLVDIGQAHNRNCLSGYNRDFYGGLLAHVTRDNHDDDILVHLKGETFNKLCMSKVSSNSKTGLKSLRVLSSLQVPNTFQLCTTLRCGTKVLICTRESSGCRVFNLDDDTGTLQEQKNVAFSKLISSICFNPYMENEILMSDPVGRIHLWDIESSASPLRLRNKDRGSQNLYDSWSTSFFGGHPRHVILANNTSLHVFDHRDKYRNGLPLFSLPGIYTKPEEQFMAACSLGFPFYSVATDFSLFLLDNRFPRTPVLNWSTEMMSPPQYLQSLGAEEEGGSCRKLLFLASQQPAEVMCLPVDMARGQPPVAPISPWRVSRIDEFSSVFSAADTSVEKRFESSLAGFTVPPPGLHGSFTVYQLDSCGDIFYQSFVPEISHMEDSFDTETRGPFQCFKACGKIEKAAAKTRAERWLAALEVQISNAIFARTERNNEDTNKQNLDPVLMSEVFSCSPSPEELWEQKQVKCTIRKTVNPNKPHENLKSFTKLECKRSQTQLLLALRDGKDIDDFLKKRETSHIRQRKMKRRDLWRKEGQNRSPSQKRRKQHSTFRDQNPESSEMSQLNILEAILNSSYQQTPDEPTSLDSGIKTERVSPPPEAKYVSPHPKQNSDENFFTIGGLGIERLNGTEVNVKEGPSSEPDHPWEEPTASMEEISETPPSTSYDLPQSGRPLLSSEEQGEVVGSNEMGTSYHAQGLDHSKVLPNNNIIAWLLHSAVKTKKEPTGSQEDEVLNSSSFQTSAAFAQPSPNLDIRSRYAANLNRVTNDDTEELDEDSDLASVCSSQRNNTLMRPDLRKMVDPKLSGFLSSPKQKRKVKGNGT